MPRKLLRATLIFLVFTIATATAAAAAATTTRFIKPLSPTNHHNLPSFREAPSFRNGRNCPRQPLTSPSPAQSSSLSWLDDPSMIHISMTLDSSYLRGSVAAILSVLRHASCPENIAFHFLLSSHDHDHDHDHHRHHHDDLLGTLLSTFPYLQFQLYHLDTDAVRNKITSSVRRALDQPLNYARMYLPQLLPANTRRIIYLDSDLVVVDDIAKLWSIDLGPHVLGAPEYCHANFTNYFTDRFWKSPELSRRIRGRRRPPCYFNTGVMVIDVHRWRLGRYTHKLENWMLIQKKLRIYELGSLPPFLLVFAGDVRGVEHRWNQHGLGGDNVEGRCRDLHPGPVSLLHWSGKGKPWLRLDSKKPCPLDSLWAPYDLFRRPQTFDHPD